MVIVDRMTTFNILGADVALFSSETIYGWQTCAEVENEYHYLGDKYISIETAINCWQDLHGRMLTQEEINEVMESNDLILK